ncbi:hypothetical protein ACOJVU_20925 [Mycobacterium sp. THU-M104]|uniref:hypothetical protein n=1 Tax=Mycobacterium sp. THU-M104 TaxID=3410515 RepID=UPI003B992A78
MSKAPAQRFCRGCANTTGPLTDAFTTAYAALLPTADVGVATGISLPACDAGLFAGGLQEFLAGDPAGLANAVGDPLAATVGLDSFSLFLEGQVVLGAGLASALDLIDIPEMLISLSP